MRKTLAILLVSLFALALAGLAAYSFMQYRNQKVDRILVHIDRQDTTGFLNEKAIKLLIAKTDSVVGKQVKQVNTAKIENLLAVDPYVEKADVYLNLSGDLVVSLKERKPVLRVYNLQNQSCYLDTKGVLFPLSNSFVPRVLPANGYIRTKLVCGSNIFEKKYRKTSLPVLFLLAKKIEANNFLQANVSQLFVNSKGKIDMVPELGRYVIHFGDSTDMNIKLENLEAFNKQVFAHGGWSKYSSINLEFTNQIVCTKK